MDGKRSGTLRGQDCVKRAFDDAQFAAVAAVHVYVGRVVTVNADDGLDFAYLLRRATLTDLTSVAVNIQRGRANIGLCHSTCHNQSPPLSRMPGQTISHLHCPSHGVMESVGNHLHDPLAWKQ